VLASWVLSASRYAIRITRDMRKLPLILALGALIAFPQYASAQANSGIDQYEENLPGAGGDRSTGGGGTGSGGSGDGSAGSGLDAGSAGFGSSLRAEEAGAGGRSGGQQPGADSNAGSRHGLDDDVSSVSAQQGPGLGNSVGTVENTSDGGGMGIALPIILGASLVGALAFLVARRLRAKGQASPA
jgi:hypothetical protein